MDIKSKEERSLNMSKIKGKNTKPEIYIRSLLFRRGFRYKINLTSLTGKPDLFFPKYKTALFVHGCFWHRHTDCKLAYIPKTNNDFWINKLEANRNRDEQVIKCLSEQGIRILIVWECTVKKMKQNCYFEHEVTELIINFLIGGQNTFYQI